MIVKPTHNIAGYSVPEVIHNWYGRHESLDQASRLLVDVFQRHYCSQQIPVVGDRLAVWRARRDLDGRHPPHATVIVRHEAWGQVVALGSVETQTPNSRYAYINNIAVDPAHRGRRLPHAILHTIEEVARIELGAIGVYGYPSAQARPLYLRMGYVPWGDSRMRREF